MKRHHLILKEKSTGDTYYTPTHVEEYGTLLSVFGKNMLDLFQKELGNEYEIVGECMRD